MAGSNRKKTVPMLVVICIAVLMSLQISAKFLVDDEYNESVDSAADSADKNAPDDSQSVLPKNVARNIEVLPVPELTDSVKITWSLSQGSSGTFIVGRTTNIPSDENTALSALSIKVVQPGDPFEVYDKNIPEGKFYYVILSKDKITERKVELYPNDNYTTNPVIISKKVSEIMLLPEVQNIKVTSVKEGSAAVTWTPLKLENVIYTVYRGTEPLSTPEKIEMAVKAGVLKDTDSFYDSLVDKSGKYYYAVTTSDTVRNEDRNLTPGESYSTESIGINVEKRTTVSNIKLTTSKNNEVRVEWTGIPNFDGEYLVYRNESVIDSQEKLAKSYLAERVDSVLSFYVDKNAVQGNNYYAIISKDRKGAVNKELVAGQNYNSESFEIGTPVRVKAISAKIAEGHKIQVTWQYSGESGNRQFKLYRSEKSTDVKNDIRNFYLLDSVDITKGSYTDTVPEGGAYFYYLVPDDYELLTDFVLARGVNYTLKAVAAVEAEKHDNFRLRLIGAKKENDGVVVSWKYSGSEGNKNYMLYRSEKLISSTDALGSSFMVDEVDISSGSYIDLSIPDGRYFYALVPSDFRTMKGFKMLKGINYTVKSVKIAAQDVTEESIDTEADIQPKSEMHMPKDLDEILKMYFFAGRYDDSIVFLKKYVLESSDPEGRAAAMFYIGRCYAAKGNYREALKYFLNSDVKHYLPDDSDFWQDYCLTRLGR